MPPGLSWPVLFPQYYCIDLYSFFSFDFLAVTIQFQFFIWRRLVVGPWLLMAYARFTLQLLAHAATFIFIVGCC